MLIAHAEFVRKDKHGQLQPWPLIRAISQLNVQQLASVIDMQASVSVLMAFSVVRASALLVLQVQESSAAGMVNVCRWKIMPRSGLTTKS